MDYNFCMFKVKEQSPELIRLMKKEYPKVTQEQNPHLLLTL